jgi:hypothetical protein
LTINSWDWAQTSFVLLKHCSGRGNPQSGPMVTLFTYQTVLEVQKSDIIQVCISYPNQM